MQSLGTWLLFLCLLAGPWTAFGMDSAFEVRAHIPVADLIPSAEYIDDPSARKSLKQILAMPEDVWQPGAVNKLTFGWTSHAYWVRLALHHEETRTQNLILEIDWPLLDDVQVFIRDNAKGQTLETMKAGDMYPFRERPILHTSFAFPLDLPAGETRHVYIRVASTSSTQIPLRLWQEKQFYEERQYSEGAQILYYGAMLIMVFYNLFIYLSVRQATYLYYSFFVIGYIILQSSLKGMAFHYVWPNLPQFVDRSISMGGALTLVFMMLFAQSFLRFRSTHPIISRTLITLSVLTSMAFVAAAFVPYRIIIKIVAALSVVCSMTALGSGIYAFATGQKEARYYVSAWAALVLGTVLYMMKQFGIMPHNVFTENAMQVGSVLEAVLLSFSLADRLNTLKESLAKANTALSDHLRNVEALVDQKTRSIRSILDTLHQGIVTIKGDDLKVQDEYAKYTESLLGTNQIAQKDMMSLIFAYSDLSVDSKARMVESLRACLGETMLQFDVNSSNLPNRCELKLPNRERIALEIDWTPIVESDETVSRILLSFRDVSEIRRLRAAADNQQNEMRVISELVQADPRKLKRFFAGAKAALDEDQRLCATHSPFDPELIKILFIDMHTIKGEARGLGLSRLSDAAHLLEEEYARVRQNPDLWSPLSLRESIAGIATLLDTYQHTFDVKLRGLNDADKLAISSEELGSWHGMVSSWTLNAMDQKYRLKLLENWSRMIFVELRPYLQTYRLLCSRVARDLNKAEPELVVEGTPIYLDKNAVPLLDKVLMHLLRNALDHGLESTEEREARHKPPRGRITFSWTIDKDWVRIQMQDDGRGLQLERIRAKAQKLGLSISEKSKLELAHLIFEAGLTTTDAVTNISGRGVGLAAVRQYLKEVGGDIQIAWDGIEGSAFAFVLLLPLSLIRGEAHNAEQQQSA
jgi:signal transduction histidine kinase